MVIEESQRTSFTGKEFCGPKSSHYEEREKKCCCAGEAYL
jgi:hypothetical protein